MAPENTAVTPQSATGNQTPDVSAAAPAAVAPAATSPAAASAPAPDTTQSGMPGAPTGTTPIVPGAPVTSPAQLQQQPSPIAPYIQAANEAAAKATQIASESTAPPPPGPHARLLSMIQGLAVGAGAFGKAIATHGKEGGVDDVLAYQNQQKQQEIQAQQARDAAKNQKLQQQIAAVNTNLALANGAALMAKLPGEMTKESLSNAAAKQGIAINAADFAAAHGGMSPDEFNTAMSDTAPLGAEGSKGVNPYFRNNANIQLQAASDPRSLGPNDPYVQTLWKTLQDPNASAKDIELASQNVQKQLAAQNAITDQAIKKDTAFANSTVGKLSTPTALADPGSQAAIQAAIDDPKTAPADVPRLRALIPQAAVAQKNAEDIKARTALAEQQAKQGDPNSAGALLANYSLTLPELKARSTDTNFIQKATEAAQRINPDFKPAVADAQAKAASSEANIQFFRNTDSLLVNNGTLDQLQSAYKNLGNTKIPAINNPENMRKAAAGSGPLAAAYAAQVGVIDDYAKVMAGSGGSDNARETALKIINLAASPEAQTAAIAQLRAQIESQRNGQIGINPYLKFMFPDPAGRAEVAGKAGTQPAVTMAAPARPAGVAANAQFWMIPGEAGGAWLDPASVKAAQKQHPNMIRVGE